MRKSILSFMLIAMLCVSLLSGCAGGGRPALSSTSAPESTTMPATAVPTPEPSFNVTVTNASSYVFNELYISPTASNDWGSDHLGSTMILKKNGSFDVTLDKYEFDNYDIRVIDEDEDEYLFKYVPLNAKAVVVIAFTDDGLAATVTKADGSTSTIIGEITGTESASDDSSSANMSTYDYTTEDFSFTVYNESSYDIYAIYMQPANSQSGDSYDILPQILSAGDSFDFTSRIGNGVYGVTDWRLYVVDTDDDTSASYDIFDPWLVSYIDINWDSSAGGYVCEFFY